MKRAIRRTVVAALAVIVTVAVFPTTPALAITDAEVVKAIEEGRNHLVGLAKGNGSFGDGGDGGHGGMSALVFMTLAYMREHPNRPHMSNGLDYLLNLDADQGFGTRQGYCVPIRIMGLSYIYSRLLGDKKVAVRQKMYEDVKRLEVGQSTNGGWRYALRGGSDYDFSVVQWPILAFREANLVGIEFPTDSLRKARDLYFRMQNADGGWHYQQGPSYGSMAAAGAASLFIINDVLDPSSGCPCGGGRSRPPDAENERHLEMALAWLSKNYSPADNPHSNGQPGAGRTLYWLYCAERVGIASGYKYFGDHNWYKEGAQHLLKANRGGNWGSTEDTCFALLFLYKGRAPVLFNKLRFDGIWNAHRRDMANLTSYIERAKEQQFHWQIVELKAPMDELHEAPILYISAENAPKLDDEAAQKKLREFTDTGGTVLFEASCGNAAARKWFQDFAKKVWPEWGLKPLGPDHGVFTYPTPLKQRPELLGINDGIRTSVFYSIDDISCAWQTRAVTAKDYLFKWGINLYTYATDGAPLRAKLAGLPPKATRYTQPVKAGSQTTLKIARVKHGGDWEAGANYGGFQKLAAALKQKANITLEVKETSQSPVTAVGVTPNELSGYTAAYLTGSGAIILTTEEKQALKAYAGKGGVLWFEASCGSGAFDASVRQLAAEMGWQLKLLPNTHDLLTGRMDPALGYNLTSGVEFRTGFRMARLGRNYAEFYGIFDGEKMIGAYSPLDIVFSATEYEAFKCKGYKPEDAAAVMTNLAIYFSTLKP
ncbi:MAG: DUF4159 domain-containing protein [Planctomycetota bacterium]|nr:DUF4159 domain-containing protein [Planctomycetota bacterium]